MSENRTTATGDIHYWMRTKGTSAIGLLVFFIALADANEHHAYVALALIFWMAFRYGR